MKEGNSLKIGAFIAVFLSFFSFFEIAILWEKIPPEVPLFYSQPWGQDQLSSSLFLFLLPVSSLIAIGLNYFLVKITKGGTLLLNIITWTATAFSFLSFYTLSRILILILIK